MSKALSTDYFVPVNLDGCVADVCVVHGELTLDTEVLQRTRCGYARIDDDGLHINLNGQFTAEELLAFFLALQREG